MHGRSVFYIPEELSYSSFKICLLISTTFSTGIHALNKSILLLGYLWMGEFSNLNLTPLKDYKNSTKNLKFL